MPARGHTFFGENCPRRGENCPQNYEKYPRGTGGKAGLAMVQ